MTYGKIMVMKIISSFLTMRNWYIYLLSLLGLFAANNAFAVEVVDLYTASVNVPSQRAEHRESAAKEALDLVFVKVSGQQNALQNSYLKDERRKYSAYIDNFRYERKQQQIKLVITFNENKINNSLVEAGLPIWGSLRPQLVLWLIEEQGLQRTIVGANEQSAMVDEIKQVNKNRGLPIVMPLMDLEDNQQIQTADVWGRFTSPIRYASMRYSPEAIVTVRVSDNSLLSAEQLTAQEQCFDVCAPQFALDWSFVSMTSYESIQEFSETYYGDSKEGLINKALGDIADMLAQQYALQANVNREYLVDIGNVDSMAKYAQISKFLAELSSVQAVKLVNAKGQNRRFSLSLLGTEQAFLDSLKLHKALRRFYDPLDPASKQGVPLFYWEPK